VGYPNWVDGLDITHPEQVWVCDITYIRLGNGFVYLAVIMDVFTRSIRGWSLGQALDTSLTLAALPMAIALCIPEIHHSNQGIQYAAQDMVTCSKHTQFRSAWLPRVNLKKTGMPSG
jgi:transposase InsO family protein